MQWELVDVSAVHTSMDYQDLYVHMQVHVSYNILPMFDVLALSKHPLPWCEDDNTYSSCYQPLDTHHSMFIPQGGCPSLRCCSVLAGIHNSATVSFFLWPGGGLSTMWLLIARRTCIVFPHISVYLRPFLHVTMTWRAGWVLLACNTQHVTMTVQILFTLTIPTTLIAITCK